MFESTDTWQSVVPFTEILARLAARRSPFPLAARTSYIQQPEALGYFEPPEFRLGDDLSGKSVLLIEAGAAVGKSTIAIELAARLNAVYFDLSQINVGTGSFQGLIFAAFGANNIKSAMEAIANGELVMVLDALDEAQARAGDTNFEAFLGDFVQTTPLLDAPAFILLGRPETVRRVEAFFKRSGVQTCVATVEYFSFEASLSFIDRELDRRHEGRPDAPHRKFAGPFREAKVTLLSFITDMIGAAGWDDRVVRSFVGYAPVLQGIGAFLDVENFYSLVRSFTAGSRVQESAQLQKSHWAALVLIVADLLAREHEKLVAMAKGRMLHIALAEGFGSWDKVYDTKEQIGLLVDYLIQPADLPVYNPMPETMQAEYRELISWMVPQHPFVGYHNEFANQLFFEYVYAWLLANPEESQRRSAIAEWVGRTYMPSPMLAHLTMMLQSVRTDDELLAGADPTLPVIPADYLAFWYDSFSSGLAGGDSRLYVWPSDLDGGRRGAAFGPATGFWFGITTSDGPLVVSRRLRNADVSVFGGIRLEGRDGLPLALGPNVRLAGDWLELAVEDLRVKPGADGVRLEASFVQDEIHHGPNIVVVGDGQFECVWPNPRYPWRNYGPSADSGLSGGLFEEVTTSLDVLIPLFKHASWWKQRYVMPAGFSAPDLFARAYEVSAVESQVRMAMRALELEGLCLRSGAFYRIDGRLLGLLGLSDILSEDQNGEQSRRHLASLVIGAILSAAQRRS